MSEEKKFDTGTTGVEVNKEAVSKAAGSKAAVSREAEGKVPFKRFRRIAALIGVILLLGIYVVAFIAAVGKWENAHAVFMTAVWLSIAVPAIIYIMMILYRVSQKRKDRK
jgi:phosphatidylserine synthase